MGFYLSLVQVVFMLSNSASFFTRRRGVPRPWNFFLSWIRAQTTPVFTTNCTILFVNFTADCTILFSTLQQNVQYFFSTLQQTVQYQTNNKLRFFPALPKTLPANHAVSWRCHQKEFHENDFFHQTPWRKMKTKTILQKAGNLMILKRGKSAPNLITGLVWTQTLDESDCFIVCGHVEFSNCIYNFAHYLLKRLFAFKILRQRSELLLMCCWNMKNQENQ